MNSSRTNLNWQNRLLIRHGMSIAMLILFFGIAVMLISFDINTKANVEIIQQDDGRIVGYLPKEYPLPSDSIILFYDTDGKEIRFKALDSHEEADCNRCTLMPAIESHPFDKATKINGTVITGKIQLMRLVFNKWIR